MKKSLILLSASSLMFALTFTSCNNGNSAENLAKENAKIDSIVNSRLDALKAEMQKECNDKVMAEALIKADSIVNAKKNSSGKGSSTVIKEKTITAPVMKITPPAKPKKEDVKTIQEVKVNPNIKIPQPK